MKKITDFTQLKRAGYDQLYADMMKALEPVAKEYGITFKPHGATHDVGYSNLKITASVIGENGQAVTPEMEDFKRHATLFGFKPEDLGRKFKMGGMFYELIGLKIKSHQYPILLKRITDGARIKSKAEGVLKALETPVTA